MKSPINLLSDFIIAPLNNIRRYIQVEHPVQTGLNKASNFIFKYSKETALIMLFCNFLSTLSSHNSQIRGLRRKNREINASMSKIADKNSDEYLAAQEVKNRNDYLINLERKERKIDCVLNIIPPFLLNNFLKKKLESGRFTTDIAREKLIKHVAADGFARDDLYSIEHIRPVRETIFENLAKVTQKLVNNQEVLPKKILPPLVKVNKALKKLFPDPVTTHYKATLEDITTDFDDRIRVDAILPQTLKKLKLRNNSAYDELNGMNNGLLVMATIGYMILASNFLMPILKHKLADREERIQLAKKGETKESIKLKTRLATERKIYENKTKNTVFREFTVSSSQSPPKENIFSSFPQYKKYPTQSTGLRI